MDVSNNTILITGGTSGIGLELARRFLDLDNNVIVTGRDLDKLKETQLRLPKVHAVQSDVSQPEAVTALKEKITRDFPDVNILINNAGIMRKINVHSPTSDLVELTREIDINLAGPIRMVAQFLPHLKTQKRAAIVNVSSGLAFVPLAISPVYSATKAALHSFTQSLRLQLKKTHIKVFELAPPGTETPLFRGDFTKEDLGGVKGMDVAVLGKHAIHGMKKDILEIRPGLSNMLKVLSRLAPQFIAAQLGKSAVNMFDDAQA